jgi:hypothetical protein
MALSLKLVVGFRLNLTPDPTSIWQTQVTNELLKLRAAGWQAPWRAELVHQLSMHAEISSVENLN